MGLRISYSQCEITPNLDRPVYLAGFGQNRRAEDVHDPLYARVLALHEGERVLVFCALDLMGFIQQDVKDVVRQVQDKQPGVDLIIASTHTHHGPDMLGLWGPDTRTRGVDPVYMVWLKERLVETILQAIQSTPAVVEEFKAEAVKITGVAKNARNPDILDDELAALQFIGDNHQVLATVVDFPCHPEVLWETNPHISADYPGVLRREIEAATGAPCIFFSGSLGGMMTPDVKDHSLEEMEQVGTVLAIAALKTLAEANLCPPSGFVRTRQEVSIHLTNILFKFAFWRKLLPDARDRRGNVITEVNLVKMGDVWIATVPGELLPRLGLALKKEMKMAGARVAMVIGLANDEVGYILPEDEFKYPLNPLKPGRHYEETMSLSKDAGTKIVAGVKGLL